MLSRRSVSSVVSAKKSCVSNAVIVQQVESQKIIHKPKTFEVSKIAPKRYDSTKPSTNQLNSVQQPEEEEKEKADGEVMLMKDREQDDMLLGDQSNVEALEINKVAMIDNHKKCQHQNDNLLDGNKDELKVRED